MNGRLHRTSTNGLAKGSAYLDDYTYLMRAYIELYRHTKEAKWLERTKKLWAVIQKDYSTEDGLGFYYRSQHDVSLITRSREFVDSAIPNANASLAHALKDLYELTKDDSFKSAYESLLKAASSQLVQSPISSLSFMDLL